MIAETDQLISVAIWRNPVNPIDVNGTDGVTPFDALVIVNYINAHPGNPSLPSLQVVSPPFYDVNGDAACTPTRCAGRRQLPGLAREGRSARRG